MKIPGSRSLRFYTTVLLISLALLFILLITYNNQTAFSMLLNRVYLNTQDTAILYQKQIDYDLDRMETFLYTVATGDADLVTLKYADTHSTKWHNALSRLEKSFKNALPLYNTDGFFCYLPESDYFITANNSKNSYDTLRRAILGSLSDTAESYRTWALLEINDAYYFLRIVKDAFSYTGTWVSADTLLYSVIADKTLQFSFATTDGVLLQKDWEHIRLTLPDAYTSGYIIEKIDQEKKLIVFQPMESSTFYLIRLIPYAEISDNQSLINALLVVSICFFMIWIFLVVFLRNWILKPVFSLTQGIERLRSGDFESSVPTVWQLDEFQRMSQAFNEMVSEIQNLKIDVYERRLQNQRLETQYLKQQITPHFLINCLNTAYQLTDTPHAHLTQKMLLNLSKHLRYTLSSGPSVILKDELDLVENYIEISGIRYPQSIRFFLTCPEEAKQATVIPLLVLNFVENSIKHEVFLGKILEIHVEISLNLDIIRICIWDSGRGFSRDVLPQLQLMSQNPQEDFFHIGIVNVLLRARHLYPTCQFHFSNRENAGAQTIIELPFHPFSSGKAEHTHESIDC